MLGWFTDFGDQAVILPCAISAVVALLIARDWLAALSWCIACCCTLGAVLLGKVACYSYPGALPEFLDIRSPSGHAASAAFLAGGLFSLVWNGRNGCRNSAAVAVLAGVAMGATRLALGVHTVGDVAVGTVVGVCGAMAAERMVRWAEVAGSRSQRPLAMLLLVAAVAGAMHGHAMNPEAAIRRSATAACGWPGCDGTGSGD